MKRAAAIASFGLAMLLFTVAAAQAAVPTVINLSATDVQGVSALLKGEVDPEGLATVYRFEYVSEAAFAGGGFTGASHTPLTPAGQGAGPHPARAAISGLAPDTAYRYRLVATNPSGAASAGASFTTTDGFGFRPESAGFAVEAIADGGGASTKAGSHPYQLDLGLRFNAGGEFEDQPGVIFPDGDLRDLRIELPPGLILNAGVVGSCSAVAFATPRSSPFEDSSSGESCPGQSQVGTATVDTARDGGTARRVGVFSLTPPPGVLAEFGLAPYGEPIVLDLALREVASGSFALVLEAEDVPQVLDLSGLSVSFWGTPWGASHDGQRGNCLKETEPAFPWAKCSVGPPKEFTSLAFLTLPGRCADSLGFDATASAWQQPAEVSATAQNEEAPGNPVPLGSCASLDFKPQPQGRLNDTKASSPAGYNFRLENDDPQLTEPDRAAASPLRQVVVRLPSGVTVNPSVGAGLDTCSPAQFGAESAASLPGAGCPNGSRIGDFSVRTPLTKELLDGSLYLATPDDPTSSVHGAQNPFDTLVAVYLVAKDPSRGLQVKLAGRIDPDPGNGDLMASFDELPQLPYSDLDLTFRAGQRSFLVTPPACGPAISRIELSSWAAGVVADKSDSSTQIQTGVGGGPCPSRPTALRPGSPGGSPELKRGLLHPLLRPPHPQGHRTGDHLLLARPAQGHHRQARGHPLLPRRRHRRCQGQAGSGRDRVGLLSRLLSGRAHPDRLRGRRCAHLRSRPHLPRRSLPRRAALAGDDQLGHGRALRPRHDRDPIGLRHRPPHRPAADRLRRLGPDPPHHRRHPPAPAGRPHLHRPPRIHPQPVELRTLVPGLDPDRLRRPLR